MITETHNIMYHSLLNELEYRELLTRMKKMGFSYKTRSKIFMYSNLAKHNARKINKDAVKLFQEYYTSYINKKYLNIV